MQQGAVGCLPGNQSLNATATLLKPSQPVEITQTIRGCSQRLVACGAICNYHTVTQHENTAQPIEIIAAIGRVAVLRCIRPPKGGNRTQTQTPQTLPWIAWAIRLGCAARWAAVGSVSTDGLTGKRHGVPGRPALMPTQ